MSIKYKITKEEYPVIWEDFFAYTIGETYHAHRRGSNFFTQALLEFGAEEFPDNPEIHGLWETDCYISDQEYGPDTIPTELFRVEERTKTVVKKYYVRVTEETR